MATLNLKVEGELICIFQSAEHFRFATRTCVLTSAIPHLCLYKECLCFCKADHFEPTGSVHLLEQYAADMCEMEHVWLTLTQAYGFFPLAEQIYPIKILARCVLMGCYHMQQALLTQIHSIALFGWRSSHHLTFGRNAWNGVLQYMWATLSNQEWLWGGP